jgi:hypothetical protein
MCDALKIPRADHYAHLIDSSHREAVEKAAAFWDRSGPKIEGWVN